MEDLLYLDFKFCGDFLILPKAIFLLLGCKMLTVVICCQSYVYEYSD